MKHDPDWYNTSESYDPLNLLNLTKEIIVYQTDNKYFYVTVYNQECTLYGYQQHTLANEHCYDPLYTKFNVGESIGITRKHCFLMKFMAQET